jgi:multiple sugar transport system permease protein
MVNARPTQNARKRVRWNNLLVPYLFIGPTLLYLGVFTILPLLDGVRLSFTDTQLIRPQSGSNTGLRNYEYLLTTDIFWNSLITTLLYTLLTVLFAIGMGTAAAILLNTTFKGRALARGLITVPWAIPTVATALIFSWMFSNQNGVLNAGTQAIGLGRHGWLIDPKFGLFAVVLTTVWAVFPLVMLVVLASLQSVPQELRETSWLDGASPLQSFKAVSLPHIQPTIQVMSLLMTIWSIRRFEIIYLLTGGGPMDSTNTLVVSIYRTAFQNQKLGRAAAIGVLGLSLSMLVTVIYFLVDRRQSKGDET